MKRSPGPSSPLGGGPSKRFEKMRSSPQMHLQNQFHQQMQHNTTSQNFYATPPPSGLGMMSYNRSVPPPTPYIYGHSAPPPPPPGGMTPRMWNYAVPPPPAPIRPPLPRGPAHQAIPPPPQAPPPEKDVNGKNKTNHTKTPGPEEDDSQTVVNKKPKRKSMSSRYGCPKEWVREDAIKAIQLEEEYSKRSTKAPTLLLRFPDPELNRDIISKYSTDIESVHFQQNSAPRYCFVHLKEGADVDKAIETISKIPFGTGFVSAELKRVPASVTSPSNPDEVDPYTLYIGNLPTTISSHTVKEHFPGAHRIDIGFAQRMKYTRYAFVRYDTVEEAMEAFKRSVNTLIESRSLIVRFRRQRSTIASGEPLPKKDEDKKREDIQEPRDPRLSREPRESRESRERELRDPRDPRDSRDPREAKESHSQKKSHEATSKSKDKESEPAKAAPASAAPGNSSVFDSPTSLESLNVNVIDSKDNVMIEAEKWKRKLQEKTKTTETGATVRRDSLEQMFGELEKRDSTLKGITTEHEMIPPEKIKVEQQPLIDEDDLSEDEDPPANCLLGARYNEPIKVKQEPEDDYPSTSHREEIYNEDYEYEEDFDLEEPEDEVPPPPAEVPKQKPMAPTEEPPNSWEIVRQRELSATEKKPDVSQLRAHIESTGSMMASSSAGSGPHAPTGLQQLNSSNVPHNERTHFIEQLYNQVKRSKDTDKRRRRKDAYADMFAQMNSDAEEDDDLF